MAAASKSAVRVNVPGFESLPLRSVAPQGATPFKNKPSASARLSKTVHSTFSSFKILS